MHPVRRVVKGQGDLERGNFINSVSRVFPGGDLFCRLKFNVKTNGYIARVSKRRGYRWKNSVERQEQCVTS